MSMLITPTKIYTKSKNVHLCLYTHSTVPSNLHVQLGGLISRPDNFSFFRQKIHTFQVKIEFTLYRDYLNPKFDDL